jgi:hypothetical protein
MGGSCMMTIGSSCEVPAVVFAFLILLAVMSYASPSHTYWVATGAGALIHSRYVRRLTGLMRIRPFLRNLLNVWTSSAIPYLPVAGKLDISTPGGATPTSL